MISDTDLDRMVRSLLREPALTPTGGLRRALAEVATVPQQRHRGLRRPDLLGPGRTSTRLTAAAVVVALVAGLLLIAQPLDRVAVTVPGAETEGLPPITGPAGNGLIAFERDGDIYVGDPATGESEAIAIGERPGGYAGSYWRPMFSPDGTRIAFMRVFAWSVETGCEIIVAAADGTDQRDITPEGLNHPGSGFHPSCIQTFAWAPDSRSVVVTVYTAPEGSPEMLLLDASRVADPVSLPFDAPFGTDAAFLRPPDGDRLLTWGGTPALGVMDLYGGNLVDLAELSRLDARGYDGFADPAWSPDGSRIAVLAENGHERHLYAMGTDGSDMRRLAAIPWHESWLGPPWSWSPDGTTIAVQHSSLVEYSPESCPGQTGTDPCAESTWVTLIDVESGVERVLDSTRSPGQGDGSLGRWSWSPDGKAILVTREYGLRPSRAAVVDIETDTVTELPWESDYFLSWQRVAAD